MHKMFSRVRTGDHLSDKAMGVTKFFPLCSRLARKAVSPKVLTEI